MVKKNTPSDEDLAAFLAANPGIKPLTPVNRVTAQKKQEPPKRRRADDLMEEEDTPPLFIDRESVTCFKGSDVLAYKHSSISNKILRNLSKGQYNVDAVLDMHGMTVATAEHRVDSFLRASFQQGWQVVLFVHGKGTEQQMPILKNKLYQWLRSIDAVLAFHSAPPAQGGRGALIVLLKRIHEER